MADEEMLQDFLLDMDFDELIPVDNFFDSYVGALSKDGSNAGQMGVPAPPLPTAGSLERAVFQDPNAGAAGIGPGMPLQTGLNSINLNGTNATWPAGAPPLGGLPQPTPLDVMADAGTNLGTSQMADGRGFLAPQQGMDMGGSMPNVGSYQEVPETSGSGGEHPSPTHREVKGRRRGQTKTERQQMLNKAAQQRYRERKKAKANELKSAVSSLQDKVHELSMVHAEKSELQERVNALEKELALKEAKLASMEQQQQHGEVTSGGPENPGVCGGDDRLDSDITDFSNQFAHEVSKMRSWLGANGYLSPDGENVRKPLHASDLTPTQLASLRELGQQCYSSCLRCLSMFTDVDVGQLVGSTLNDKQGHFSGDASQWHDLVIELSLDPKVMEHALQLRERYLDKLEQLFHTRQILNLEAVKVLLPQEVGGMAEAGGKKWKDATNFFTRYRHAYDTANVLRRLRTNLADEQKALAELDYLVYVKLLDPVQLSRCILTAFPQHCDVVSLLNAIHGTAAA